MTLSKFLVKAKKATYASGEKAKKLSDGFHEFVFADGNLTYRDRYHAEDPRPFGGEEVVFENDEAVWMMNYFGFMVSEDINDDLVYAFLRKAMSLVNEEIPFRGPESFKEGDFEYKNEVDGNINQFKGTERIFFKGKEVYRLDYHGGEL